MQKAQGNPNAQEKNEAKQREMFPISNQEEQDRSEFKTDTDDVLKNIDMSKRNQMVPPPPKKGEFMYCQVCGQVMEPQHFSKTDSIRKREFKWQIHEYCFNWMDQQADIQTPGLLSERKRIERENAK